MFQAGSSFGLGWGRCTFGWDKPGQIKNLLSDNQVTGQQKALTTLVWRNCPVYLVLLLLIWQCQLIP